MEAVGNDFDIHLYDIEGCLPNMPKEAIHMASLDVMENAKRKDIKGFGSLKLDPNRRHSASQRREHMGHGCPWLS